MQIYISKFLSIYKLKSGRKCQNACHFRMNVFVFADQSAGLKKNRNLSPQFILRFYLPL